MRPLYGILVRSILPIVRSDQLAVRLPATLGYCGMALCLAAFCRRRLPAVYALIVSLLVCDTCLYYSTEGRAYGLVLGCAAGALLCWQAAIDGRHRGLAITLLAVFLALLPALHYLAIFFLVPIFLAEMARARPSGKMDLGVLIAMVPAPLVLFLHYPLIVASGPLHAHFWASADLRMIGPFYDMFLFSPLLYIYPLAVAILVAFPKSPVRQGSLEEGMPMHEWVAIVSLALMPAALIAVSKYTTHIFVYRYVLWAVIGLAVISVKLLFKVAGGRAVVGATLFAFLMVSIARQELGQLRAKPVLHDGEAVLRELDLLPDGPEPIVIPDAHVFLELSYYARPRLRERLIYAASPDLTRATWVTIRMLSYSSLSAVALICDRKIMLRFSLNIPTLYLPPAGHYLPWHLVAGGYSVVPVGSEVAPPLIFQVNSPSHE